MNRVLIHDQLAYRQLKKSNKWQRIGENSKDSCKKAVKEMALALLERGMSAFSHGFAREVRRSCPSVHMK
jgi:hypothetical protein